MAENFRSGVYPGSLQSHPYVSLKREGDSEVKSTLSDFPWKDTEGKNIAFDYYRPKMERADDDVIDLP